METEIELKDKQLNEFKRKGEEYSKLVAESRVLRDELDILREIAARVPDLEDRIKKLVVKAEAVTDLRKQLKTYEQTHEENIRFKIELEEANKKIYSQKLQVDKYKDQIASLSADISHLHSSIEENESELRSIKSERDSLVSQKKKMEIELDNAKAEINFLNEKIKSNSIQSSVSQGFALLCISYCF